MKVSKLAAYNDFKKAFDTVKHSILLIKLRNLNLSDHAVNFFKNYLSELTNTKS